MCYLQHFDWTEHAFGLFGPVRLSHLPSFLVVTDHPCSWPAPTQPLVTQQLLQAYSVMTAAGGGGGERAFSAKYCNVIDPANPYNNLGRSVSYQNVGMIRQAMIEGALRLRMALEGWVGRSRIEARLGKSGSFASTRSGGAADEGLVSSSAPTGESLLSSASSPLTPLSGSALAAAVSNDEDVEQLQAEEDQKEAYRIVSLLFERTLQAYSGRTTFSLRPRALKKVRPAALPILGADGQPVVIADRAVLSHGSAGASRNSSPHPLTPALSSTPSSPMAASSAALQVSDSELETDAESEQDEMGSRSRTSHYKQSHATTGSFTTRNHTPSSTTTSHFPSALSPSASTTPTSSASASTTAAASSHQYTVLDGNLPTILDNLQHAKQFDTPDVTEHELVTMITKILLQCGSVPVGKLGSLLHNVMNNHSLPSMLKEKFGGLKRFLERHGSEFMIGVDHPFNPHVHLTGELLARERERGEGGGGGGGGAGLEVGSGGGLTLSMGVGQQQQQQHRGGGGGGGGSIALSGGDAAGGMDSSRPPRQQQNRGNSRQSSQSAGLQQHQQPQQQQQQSQQTRQPTQPKGNSSSASGTSWTAPGNQGVRGQHPGGSMAAALQALTSTPPHSAASSNDQHAAPFSRSQAMQQQPQRFAHSSNAAATQPLYSRGSPHPRMASSEGLNVTAPAFVPGPVGHDGSGLVGRFEHAAGGGVEGGSEMDGQYGEIEYSRGGSGGIVGNGQSHGAYQQRFK